MRGHIADIDFEIAHGQRAIDLGQASGVAIGCVQVIENGSTRGGLIGPAGKRNAVSAAIVWTGNGVLGAGAQAVLGNDTRMINETAIGALGLGLLGPHTCLDALDGATRRDIKVLC